MAQWLPVAFTILSAIISITAMIVVMRERGLSVQKDLARDEIDFKTNIARIELFVKGEMDKLSSQVDTASRDLSQALHMIKLISGEQALINKVTSGTLNSLVDKTDNNEEKIHRLEKDMAVVEIKLSKWQ